MEVVPWEKAFQIFGAGLSGVFICLIILSKAGIGRFFFSFDLSSMSEKKIINPKKSTTTTIPVKPVADTDLSSDYKFGS